MYLLNELIKTLLFYIPLTLIVFIVGSRIGKLILPLFKSKIPESESNENEAEKKIRNRFELIALVISATLLYICFFVLGGTVSFVIPF